MGISNRTKEALDLPLWRIRSFRGSGSVIGQTARSGRESQDGGLPCF